MKTVAEKFRRLREKRGLSQQEVADSIGVSIAMVSRIENNPRQLKVDYIDLFASYYEIPLRKLFSRNEDKLKRQLDKVKVQVTFPSKMNNSSFFFQLAQHLEQIEKHSKEKTTLCK